MAASAAPDSTPCVFQARIEYYDRDVADYRVWDESGLLATREMAEQALAGLDTYPGESHEQIVATPVRGALRIEIAAE